MGNQGGKAILGLSRPFQFWEKAANRAELFPPEENGDEAAGAESSDNEAASDTSDDDIEITNISDLDEDAK